MDWLRGRALALNVGIVLGISFGFCAMIGVGCWLLATWALPWYLGGHFDMWDPFDMAVVAAFGSIILVFAVVGASILAIGVSAALRMARHPL